MIIKKYVITIVLLSLGRQREHVVEKTKLRARPNFAELGTGSTSARTYVVMSVEENETLQFTECWIITLSTFRTFQP